MMSPVQAACMHHALRAAALECCHARVMRAARSACSMHACACYRSTHVPAGNPPSCAADGGHTTMRRSSACAAQRAKGGLFKADDGSSATVPDRPLPASSAAAPARARPPSAAGAPPPGSLVRGAFDRSMAARLVQPARASFVLVESCGPVQSVVDIRESPKDQKIKYQKASLLARLRRFGSNTWCKHIRANLANVSH